MQINKTDYVSLYQHIYLTLPQVFTYVGVQASFQYGIMAPFRGPQRDPPPPQLQQPQHHLQAIEDCDHLAGGEAPQRAQRHLAAGGRLQRNQAHQRRPNRTREEAAKVVVETLHTAERPYTEDEMDAQHNLSAESDSENQQEMQEELAGASASSVCANWAQSKTKPTESVSCQSETKPQKVNENLPKDEPSRDSGASKSPAEGRPSQTDVQVSSF